MDKKEIKKEIKSKVREGYARIANQEFSCCEMVKSCCGNATTVEDISKNIGYTDVEIKTVPWGCESWSRLWKSHSYSIT